VVGAKVVEFLKGTDATFKTSAVRDAFSKQEQRIKDLINGTHGRENAFLVREEMHDALIHGAGIFRNGKDLAESVETLKGTLARARKVGLGSNGIGASPELALALKIEGMVKLALCVTQGALMRTESRGAHTREDYPDRNDHDWLNRTLAYWKTGSDELPTLTYEPATPSYELPPGERGYGGGKIIPMENPPKAKPSRSKA